MHVRIEETPTTAPPLADELLACLQLMQEWYGTRQSATTLCAGLPLVDGRLTPALFEQAASRAGLTAKVVERPLEQIPQQVLPVVLALHGGLACLLVEWTPDQRAKVIMPEESSGGSGIMSLAALEALYTGAAIFVRPAQRFEQRAQEWIPVKPRSWFWDTIGSYRKEYRDVIVASVVINLFALGGTLFTMTVYDRVIPNNAFETLWMLAIGVALVFVFEFTFKIVRGIYLDIAGKKADVRLSAILFQQILGLRLEQRPSSAGTMASNMREFESVRDFFTSATLTTIIDLPFVLLFVGVIAWIHPLLAVPPLVAIPLTIVAGLLLQKPMIRAIEENFKETGQKQGFLVEIIAGLDTIKSLVVEGRMQAKWERMTALSAQSGLKTRLLSSLATNFTGLVQQLVNVAVVIVGVYQIAEGNLTMGGLIAATILGSRAMAPLGQVAGLMTRYQHTRLALSGLNNIMAQPTEREEGRVFLDLPAIQKDLVFDKVCFSYPSVKQEILQGLSLRIQAGERVAILGRIGSGKSTIARLISGLYQPTSGAIYLDGLDSRQLDPALLRKQIGYVQQEVTLFYGSVRDNICMGQSRISDEALIAAVQMSGAEDFIRRHPSGFDALVGEQGAGLSGGQRQAVGIARAIVGQPSVLVMDEPTSAMDHGTENQVIQAMRTFVEGRTLVLITHKPALLALVERIIVVEGGQVVMDGPRDKVLAALKSPQRKEG